MIYYTGDTHGQAEKILEFIRRFKPTADDAIVILGDAGFNYYGNERGDIRIKRRLNDCGITIFCVHGNHERRPESLPYYYETTWRGGKGCR
jgi:3-oxoacid CoA-transferase subunit A